MRMGQGPEVRGQSLGMRAIKERSRERSSQARRRTGPPIKLQGGVRWQGQETAVRSKDRGRRSRPDAGAEVSKPDKNRNAWLGQSSEVGVRGQAHLAVTLPICLVAVGVKALMNIAVAGATGWASPPAPRALLVHPGGGQAGEVPP